MNITTFHKLIDAFTHKQQTAFDVYVTIIVNRQKNPLSKDEYGETHHIIPRSCGGPLRKRWNLVKLTPEEHYMCHYLLTFIYAVGEEHDKMVYAWNQLSNRIRGEFVSAEEYGRLKRECAKLISKAHKGKPSWNRGIPRSEEVKRKLSEARKGMRQSDEAKRKVSEANKGKLVSSETRNKIARALTGRLLSEETKRKLSESKKGRTHVGHPAWNQGKTGIYSEETRRKMSEARKAYWAKRRESIDGLKD